MMNVPSATTWGSPTAIKHALLLHGLTASSASWHRVASGLAAQGYLVTAPNPVGHPCSTSTDYTVSNIVQDLRPYLKARSYSIIMGHSIGALVALALLEFLPPQSPTAIVLVDPPLHLATEHLVFHDAFLSEACVNTKHADKNPPWSREGHISRELGMGLCPAQVAHSVFEANEPRDFGHHLQMTRSTKWKVTALLADPARCFLCPVESFRPYSYVRPVIVPGAGHCIHCEFPEVVVAEALKTVIESEVAVARQWLGRFA